MENLLTQNVEAFEDIYKTIGGILYPESHIIRIWNHYFKYLPPPH